LPLGGNDTSGVKKGTGHTDNRNVG